MQNDDTKNKTDISNSSEEIDDTAKMEASNQKYQDELEELEKIRKEHEEKKKEMMKRIREDREKKKKPKEEDEEIGEKKKTYGHTLKVFRHNKLNNFSAGGVKKINKALHKIHGVDIQKKVAFLKAIEAYNSSKPTLTRKSFDKFARSFRSKNYSGKNYKNIKEAGIDIKEMRHNFSKRDIDKLRRGITGEENRYAYKSKASDIKKGNPSATAGNTRPH